MKKRPLLIGCAAAILAVTGCDHSKHSWRAEQVATITGFNVPECALYAPDTGLTYVSSVESKPDEYWTDDAKGYISVLGKDNRIKTHRWVNSEPSHVLHAPKGMCLLGEHLYFTDNSRLMRCMLTGEHVEVLASGFKQANDLATDGRSIWVSDTAAGKIFCISTEGDRREIMAPPGINGITFSGEEMFGVSWDLHEIYELDPSGKNAPAAFGLAEHFTALDSIEVLDDGTFIISDFMGNAVYSVSPDRSTVRTLIEIHTPADIGINRKDGILYVPHFKEDRVSVYRLTK